MIVPADIPLEDRKIEDLTHEEARELLRRNKVCEKLRALGVPQLTCQQQAPRPGDVKAEDRQATRKRTGSPVVSGRPLKTQHEGGKEVIDLSFDTDDEGPGPVKEERPPVIIRGVDRKGHTGEDQIETVDLFDD